MRLWHYKLIPALPEYQLRQQWRELCSIARTLAVEGQPKQMLVNRIMNYPPTHLCSYAARVIDEMGQRGIVVKPEKFFGWIEALDIAAFPEIGDDELFKDWHNSRYYLQCYYNLQEKKDCGGITCQEWDRLEAQFVLDTDYVVGE